jgi:hypothetical protein
MGHTRRLSCLLAPGGGAACSRDLSELRQRQAEWKRAEIVAYTWGLRVTEPLFGSRTLVVEVQLCSRCSETKDPPYASRIGLDEGDAVGDEVTYQVRFMPTET